MSKTMKLANIIMFLMVALGDVVYMFTDALLAKAVTSGLFVILGVLNAIYMIREPKVNKKFVYCMLAGLFFAFLGDIVLELVFEAGAGLFALGHVLFFVSYLMLEKCNWKDFIPGTIIFVPSLLIILLVPIFNFGGAFMEIVCIVYALIISAMLGKAISNLIRQKPTKSALYILLVVGSALFFFSDLMLLFRVFGNVPYVGILCLATYYPAECILAFSILFSQNNRGGELSETNAEVEGEVASPAEGNETTTDSTEATALDANTTNLETANEAAKTGDDANA